MEIRFDNVSKSYGNTTAVDQLNLTIEPGALHFLLGPSGCGKTTTLRMLAGLESVTSGNIYFDGKDVTQMAAAERGIGMVFQNYALWPHMSVRKNISYGLKLKKIPANEARDRIDLVCSYTQLGPYLDRLPGQLSGGQQQRVALARALAIRPNVLLLDEPLSNLDAKLRLEMRDHISDIHDRWGITTVYVTHDQKEALSMGSHISVIDHGKLVQSDTPRRLYYDPRSVFVADFMGEANILEATITQVDGNGDPTVRCALGNFIVKRRHLEPKLNERVALAIRPETIGLAHSDHFHRFSARIKRHTYLGDMEQLAVETESGTVKVSLFNTSSHSFHTGDSLSLGFDQDAPVLLPWVEAYGSKRT